MTVNFDDGRVAAELSLGPSSIYVIPGGETTLTTTWRNAPRFAHVRSVANITASFAKQPQQIARSSGISFWLIDWLTVAIAALLVALLGMVVAMRRRLGRLLQERLRERRDVRRFKADRRARR